MTDRRTSVYQFLTNQGISAYSMGKVALQVPFLLLVQVVHCQLVGGRGPAQILSWQKPKEVHGTEAN